MDHAVLLVDDDSNILRGLARTLRHQPYQLYTTTSGNEAQIIVKSRNVHVIVSDEEMPGMRGADLLAWVAEHYPEVVRIVLTGRPTVDAAIRAINEGAVYQFFTKPCNPTLLAVAIRKALEHADLLAENRKLNNLNSRQLRELESYRRRLETLTELVAQDIQEPLGVVARACHSLEERRNDRIDTEAKPLIENAVDGAAEVHRLLAELLEHCRSRVTCLPAK